MPTIPALSVTEIALRLQADLPGWTLTDNALQRVHTGDTYLDSLQLLVEIGQLSERQDHHPDLQLHYKTLTVRYWTHRAKGVTSQDFELAIQVEKLIQKYPAES